MKEVRAAPGGIHSDLAQGDADALDHDVGRVGVGDPAARLEGLQHRKVRGGRAVREALRLDVPDGLADDALAELVEQARLADPGLTADPDDLALAPHRRLEAAPEELDLAVAADERRHVPSEAARRGPGEVEYAGGVLGREIQQLEAALQERR